LLPNGTSAQIVFVGDEGADFYAVRAASGKLLWSKKLGRQNTACINGSTRSEGITSAPVIDRVTDRVYVLDAMGVLSAFDLATGKQASGFPPVVAFADANDNHSWSGLLLTPDGKTLYYPTASRCDEDIYYGTVNAINTATQAITTFHVVANPSQYYGNGVWGWGGESIDPSDGNLYAGVGNAQGSSLGESAPNSDSVLELTGTLGFVADEQPQTIAPTQTEMDIGTTPVIYDDQGSCIAVERKDGHFFTIVRTALANGNFVSNLDLGGLAAMPAYDPVTHALYVDVPHGLVRLNVGPNCAVSIAWQKKSIGASGYQSPVIAHGVVYAAGKDVLYAFDAKTGAILWSSGTTISGTIAAAPTVVNGRVYALSWDGHLYAFGL
jgi:hypothetical protein